MLVYHGSLDKIIFPKILYPVRTLDYGAGFYTTTSFEQARRWVMRKLTRDRAIGYVKVYNWDKHIKSLRICKFHIPDKTWVEFVMKNRLDRNYMHGYDVVWGPVANDRVYAAFALYEQGILDIDTLIKELRTYKLVDQILFHTEQALNTLDFKESKEIVL